MTKSGMLFACRQTKPIPETRGKFAHSSSLGPRTPPAGKPQGSPTEPTSLERGQSTSSLHWDGQQGTSKNKREIKSKKMVFSAQERWRKKTI